MTSIIIATSMIVVAFDTLLLILFLYLAIAAIRLVYGAQNEAYMSRSAEKWGRGLCFNELGVCG